MTVYCDYSWHYSNWFRCTESCGEGRQFRLVFCARQEVGVSIPITVDDQRCPSDSRPTAARRCNMGPCATWTTSKWSKVLQ